MEAKLETTSPSFAPEWRPLEDAIGQGNCAYWMYMGGWALEGGIIVHAYKHKLTRSYINISDDDRTWIFTGDGYSETDKHSAIKKAMSR
jgi:hypothetical protein